MRIYKIKYYFFALLFLVVPLLTPNIVDAQSRAEKIAIAREELKVAKTDTARVEALIDLADALNTGCVDTASELKYTHEGLALAEKINWDLGKMWANFQLGLTYQRCIRNYPLAISYYQKTLSVAKSSDDRITEIRTLRHIGATYLLMTQYQLSLDNYKRALELNPDPNDQMEILGNMGVIYANVGEYPNALIYYDSSLQVLNAYIKTKKRSDFDDTAQMGGLLITIGDTYISMAQYDKALDNYNKVLKISEQSGLGQLGIWALKGIGNTYEYKKDHEKAIAYYQKALVDCIKERQQDDEAAVLNKLGNIYLQTGAIDEAMNYTIRSLKLAEENKYIEHLPAIYITLGGVYTRLKKYSEAVTYLKKAIALSEESGALDNEKNALQTLSSTYKQMNQPALALDAFEQYISIRDSIYNIGKANEFTRLDLKHGYQTDSLKHADEYSLKMQKQKVFTYSGYTGLVAVLLLSFFIYRNYSHQKKANLAISRANEIMNDEKQRSEALLLNILPQDVAIELKTKGNVSAKQFDHVTVLFTDFVNFTEAGERLSTEALVAELHTCFMAFDQIIGRYNIEKIKTVGDAYLAVSGLPHANPRHASDIVNAALECRDFMVARKKALGDDTFAMRVGINSGTVVAGIVGVKKFAYDIWGDTVNTAARMEQYSDPDKINISQTTYELVKDEFTCTDRGEIDAKHKGKMRMYFVEA